MNVGSLTRQHTGLILVCLLFIVLGILRLNDLSLYTPDSDRYLIFGNSIAQGKGFIDDTQPEPDRFFVQGPLYPVLLAPIEMFFPLSLTAAKVWTLLWGVFAIVLFHRWIGQRTDRTLALVSTIFFAFNPLTVIYSTEVLSEAPYFVFFFLSMLLFEKYSNDGEKNRKIFLAFIGALGAVVLLREVGIALIIAAALFFFTKKQFARAGIVVLAAGGLAGLWYIRNHWLIGSLPPSEVSNFALIFRHVVTDQDTPIINELALRLWINLKSSMMQVSGMLLYPLFLAQQFKLGLMPSAFYQELVSLFTSFGKYIVLMFTVPLISYGIVSDIRISSSGLLKLLFVFIYYGLLLIYPVLDIRFLLIFLPLILYYVVLAIQQLLKKWPMLNIFRRHGILFGVGLVLLIPNCVGIYEILKLNLAYRKSPVEFYDKYGQKSLCPVMYTQPWSLMGEWIDRHLPENVTLASPAKNLATVVGNRKVLEIDQGVVQPVFEMLLRDNHVDYLLSPSRGQDLKTFHFLMIESKRYSFEPTYHVANLYLYKVHSRLREHIHEVSTIVTDTANASFMVEKGRKAMLEERYGTARQLFQQALMFDTTHPALLYQMILFSALTEDSAWAKHYYDKLYTLPQSLGYLLPARLQLQTMSLLANARVQTLLQGRAIKMYDAASMYWRLGYPKRAVQVINEMFAADSTYFRGMLWGMYYNLLVEDTVIAKQYLGVLRRMDGRNPVVKAFDELLKMGDSLKCTESSLEKSRYHVAIGSLYQKIELNEDAINEAELALRENPRNVDAYLLMAETFERKINLQMARRIYDEVIKIEPENKRAQIKSDSIKAVLAKKL